MLVNIQTKKKKKKKKGINVWNNMRVRVTNDKMFLRVLWLSETLGAGGLISASQFVLEWEARPFSNFWNWYAVYLHNICIGI